MEYQYLELRTYNNTNQPIPLQFTNTRSMPILDNSKDWTLSIIRWDLNSKLVPCFVPKIQVSPLSPYTDPTKTRGTVPPYTSKYLTDMELVLIVGNTYYSMFVEWFPYDKNKNLFPPADLSESSILQSPFFYCYSALHLCTLIEKTFNKLFFTPFHGVVSQTPIKFKKSDNGHYCLLLPAGFYPSNASNPFQIGWNNSVDSMFKFDTSTSNVDESYSIFNIDPSSFVPVSIGVQLVTYLPLYSGGSGSAFPFKCLKFLSNDLQVMPLKKMNSFNDMQNINENIITDYVFTLDDIESIYSTIYYAPDSYEREINIVRTNNANQIKVVAMLETSKNISVPVWLDAGQSASILIRFSGE